MKHTKLLLISVSLVLLSCGGYAYVPQDVFLTNQGFAAVSNSNYPEAEAYLLVSLNLNPNNPYTLLNLGAVYPNTGRTLQALQMYERVVELDLEEVAVQSNREGYNGRVLSEIARENLRGLRVGPGEKGSIMESIELDEYAVTDAALFASASYAEENQKTISIASRGGPSGIGASDEGSGGGGDGDGDGEGEGDADGGGDGDGDGDGGGHGVGKGGGHGGGYGGGHSK